MSMTGFGRAESLSDLGAVTIEIKSVNHRFLEPRLFLPRDLASLELPLLRIVKQRLTRGKVDVSIRWQPSPTYTPKASFNAPLVERYATEVRAIAETLGLSEPVRLDYLLSLPGVQQTDSPRLDDTEILGQLSATLEQAIETLQAERRREGLSLEGDLLARLETLRASKRDIDARGGEVLDAYRAKLAKKAVEWAQSASIAIDAGRLETEVLMFAERSDITEESVRLEMHIDAFRDALSKPDLPPQGKSMDFLSQELLRETNTIASKSRDCAIASTVISMKNEIEKIREQAMNIE